MASQEEERPGQIDTGGGSYVGGGASAGGDFVGRDKFIGLSGEEVNRLIETLLHNIRPEYMQPGQLGEALGQFRTFHETISEWKELHNFLDNSVQFYDQFWDQARKADRRNFNLANLRNSWMRIALELDALLKWAEGIQLIGKRFNHAASGRLEGEEWAIKLEIARQDIEQHLKSAEKRQEPTSGTGALLGRLLNPGQLDEQWFERLNDLASNYRTLILFYLHHANEHLRSTATELVEVSQRVLRR